MDNIPVDAISGLKMLEINTEPLEYTKTEALINTEVCIEEVITKYKL